MALSDEQRAMLRLLAQREQGYDDIAALMGLSVAEVRAKVVGALAQLEAEGEPRPDVPPPFPKTGEEGGTTAKATPSAPEPLAAKETEPAPAEAASAPPKAEPPKPKPMAPDRAEPVAPKGRSEPNATPAAAPAGGSSGGGGRTITLPSGRGLWPWIGGAAAIIAIVVIVVLVAGGGGDSSSTATGTTAQISEGSQPEEVEPEADPEEAPTGENASLKDPTQAVLEPVGGGSGGGTAIFLKAKVKGKERLVLGVVAHGLEPTGKGEVYAVCLAQSGKRVLPVASTVVKADGKVESEVIVPTEVLAFVASGVFDKIYLTRADNSRLGAALKAAAEAGKAPDYTGEPVLIGTVTGPLVGAALREEEAQEAEEKE